MAFSPARREIARSGDASQTSGVVRRAVVHFSRCSDAQLAPRRRIGSRWASRTSNPASGSRQVGGGFDSHTLPPLAFRGERMAKDQVKDKAAAGERKRVLTPAKRRQPWWLIGGAIV